MSNTHTTRSIAFIDSRVADYQTLIAGLPTDVEVILINGGNGLQTMVAALAECSNLDAIHVLSHGSSGALQLGDVTLTSANLNSYAPLLAQIGQSLTAQGDLLLYGCKVGAGEAGRDFVESVARVMRVDVAASDDLTGNAALGGNWILERVRGSIEAATVAVAGFAGVLDDKVYSFNPTPTDNGATVETTEWGHTLQLSIPSEGDNDNISNSGSLVNLKFLHKKA